MDFDHNTFRTNAHLAEYFILGIALAVFTKSRGCKWWVAIVTGCGIGFLDEVVKIFLPGREFGTGDLIRDFIGVGIAVILVTLIIGLLKIDAK